MVKKMNIYTQVINQSTCPAGEIIHCDYKTSIEIFVSWLYDIMMLVGGLAIQDI